MSDRPRLSVIINTYNRRGLLLRCLDHVRAQTLDSSCFEILVVDDGSTDGTLDALGRWRAAQPAFAVREIPASHSGYPAARNLGIRAARGDLLLFMGDDIFLWPETLQEHLREHDRFPDDHVGVLGYVCWHPDLQSPRTDYAAQSGFGFDALLRAGARLAPWHALYTCNVSLKRSLLERAGGFNEALLDSSYDDTELGYRLSRDHGLVLRLNYNAGAFHYHPLDRHSLRQRLRGRRQRLPLLFEQHPELRNPARLRFRYRWLNLCARWLAPFEGIISGLIRLLVSLRQRGWEGFPVVGDDPLIRADLVPRRPQRADPAPRC